MRKIFSYLAAAVLISGLILSGGCMSKGHNTAAIPETEETPAYTVAVSGTFPPFGMLGPDGRPQGFELDLMNAIAEAAGFRVKYVVTSWQAKMPALKSKQVDILLCSMTITDERKKEVDFSAPYFESTNYILVPKGSKIKSINDLKGKTVAVLQASTSDFAVSGLLGKNYKGIKRFKHTTTAFLELRNGNVDAALGDSGIVMYYVKNNPEADLEIIKDDTLPKEYYGMAVRKGDSELLRKINAGLEKIIENGKYNEIYQKWFN